MADRPLYAPPDRAREDRELSWPGHVWRVGQDRLDLLGVDSEGNLYWDGHPVEVRKGVTLSRWQKIGAVLVTVSAVIAALAAVASAVADWLALPH